MRITIVGGGIASVYLANNIKKRDSLMDVTIISEEKYPPYDRIHLCRLLNGSESINEMRLELNPTVRLELNQKIVKIDPQKRKVYSKDSAFGYDKLIIATGSIPNTLFDIREIKNASVFRSVNDCQEILQEYQNREMVIVGSGAIGLELLEALDEMEDVKKITMLVLEEYLYDENLSIDSIKFIKEFYLRSDKIQISYYDEIVDTTIENHEITLLKTNKQEIKNPYLIFGVGIRPNIDFARETLVCNRGILTDNFMQTSNEHIYAVGECAELREINFIAGHVKECTLQADVAIEAIWGSRERPFEHRVAINMLKVGEFSLVDVRSFDFGREFERVVIASKKEERIDEYYLQNSRLTRFVGLNSNVDIGYIESLIKEQSQVDFNYLYENRVVGKRGRLICSCENIYYQDIVDIVTESGIGSFNELQEFSEAGRVCGQCKKMVEDVIAKSQELIDPNMPRLTPEEIKLKKEIEKAQKRIDKFNKIHPQNRLTTKNLESAMKMIDVGKDEINSWVSMVTADMKLHPNFEEAIEDAIYSLNRVPIIWLELSDCTGNSEAFIKSTNPAIEDLIFDYISLDYHELLMSASGEQSESVLENIIQEQKGKFILIVEGAVPLGMDGKYLRIGPKGETGLALLQRCAKSAGLILAVGSCAFDGGVVASAPNPTQAVGVAEALGRDDIINLSGCPVNPTNIIGTLLSYLMFEELPPLDKLNRPLWAYEGRVHDNCERRGHYELGEFVKEWGDIGAKKGWCLFEMGCKGPYTNVNCPTMKFNQSTSWPVQAGHGCMGCTEIAFFDKFANERAYEE